jgi:hypothetical protein
VCRGGRLSWSRLSARDKRTISRLGSELSRKGKLSRPKARELARSVTKALQFRAT